MSDNPIDDYDEVMSTADLAKLPAALVSGFEDVEQLHGHDPMLLIVKELISKRKDLSPQYAGIERVRNGGPATFRIAFKSVTGLTAALRKPIVLKGSMPDDPSTGKKGTLTVVPELYTRCELVLGPAVLGEFPSPVELSAVCAKLSVTLSDDGERISSSSTARLDRFQQFVAGKMMGKRSTANSKSTTHEASPNATPSVYSDTLETMSVGESASDVPSATPSQQASTAVKVATAEPGLGAARVQLGNKRTQEDNATAITDHSPPSPLYGATAASTPPEETGTVLPPAVQATDSCPAPITVPWNDDYPVTTIDDGDWEEPVTKSSGEKHQPQRCATHSAIQDNVATTVPQTHSKQDDHVVKAAEITPALTTTRNKGDTARNGTSAHNGKSQEQRAGSQSTATPGDLADHSPTAGASRPSPSGEGGISSPASAEDITAQRSGSSQYNQEERYFDISPDVLSFLNTAEGNLYAKAVAKQTGVKLSYTKNGRSMVLVGKCDADLDAVVKKIWYRSAQHHSRTQETRMQADQPGPDFETRSTSQHSSGEGQQPTPGVTTLALTTQIANFLHSEKGKKYLGILDSQGEVNINVNPNNSTACIIGSSAFLRDRTLADICAYSTEHESNELSRQEALQHQQHDQATVVRSSSSSAHRMGTSNDRRKQSARAGDTVVGGALGVQRNFRQFMLTPAAAEYLKTSEGSLFQHQLLQRTGVSVTVTTNGIDAFLHGPSESQLDEAMSELTSVSEYNQLDRSFQHGSRQDEQGLSTPHDMANTRHGIANTRHQPSNPYRSQLPPRGLPVYDPRREDNEDNGDMEDDPRLELRSRRSAGSSMAGKDHHAARTAPATPPSMHEDTIPGNTAMLFYLMEVRCLSKMAEEHNCRISVSTDGSKLIIQSQSRTKLRLVVAKVQACQETVEEDDQEIVRLPSHITTSMQDRLVAAASEEFDFQLVKCYVEKRHFMILGGLQAERNKVKAYIQQLLEQLEHGDGGKSKVEESLPPAAYSHTARGSGGLEKRKRPIGHSVPTVAPTASGSLLYPISSKKRASQAQPDPNSRTYPSGVKVSILQGDITKQKVSAIVNAANGRLDHRGGVALAVARAAGNELVDDSRRQLANTRSKFLNPGEVLTTMAGRLRCDKVIHAVGPNCHSIGNMTESCRLLNQVVFYSLREAAKHDPKATSIAFPAISSGNYGMPEDKCAQIMLGAIHTFCSVKEYPYALTDIRIVLFQEHMMRPFRVALANLSIPSHDMLNAKDVAAGPETRDLDDIFNVGAHAHRTPDKQKPPRPARIAERAAVSGSDECPVCLTSLAELSVTTLPCKHQLCTTCLARMKNARKEVCPLCMKPFGQVGEKLKGSTMVHINLPTQLSGHHHHTTIQITYNIPAGTQSNHHPNPGRPYSSDRRVAYLPNSDEGQRVLQLLKRAFNEGLTFTIGHSTTRGVSDVVTWNDIHHKTSMCGGEFSFPDPGYLARVRDELAAKGIR